MRTRRGAAAATRGNLARTMVSRSDGGSRGTRTSCQRDAAKTERLATAAACAPVRAESAVVSVPHTWKPGAAATACARPGT